VKKGIRDARSYANHILETSDAVFSENDSFLVNV
jgi:hypothetical protein